MTDSINLKIKIERYIELFTIKKCLYCIENCIKSKIHK